MRKQIKFALLNLIISLASLATPELARGQYVGTVSLQTIQQTLANTASCTGSPQVFVTVNLGQTHHLATAASTDTAFVMEIDGIDKLNNVFKISDPLLTVNPNAFLSQASGYLPIIEVSVTCAAGNTFSLSYSGDFSSNKISSVGTPNSGNSGSSTTGSNVQGMIPTGQNGLPIFPVIAGGVQQALNSQFLNVGLDNFATQGIFQPFCSVTCNPTLTFTPPVPSKAGEWGLVFFFNTQIGGGTSTFVGNGWTCIEASCLQTGGGFPVPAQKALASSSANSFNWAYTAAVGPSTVLSAFVELNNVPTVRQHVGQNGAGASLALANALQGSALVYAVSCQSSPCAFDAVTDTQGLRWRQLETSVIGGSFSPSGGVSVWMSRDVSAAGAETITVTPHAGTTISGSYALELTGLLPSTLNTPSTPVLTDSRGGIVAGNVAGLTDPCQTAGSLKLSAPINISSATTTQLVALLPNQTIYPCGGYVEIAASSGAATATIQFEYGTGAACAVGTTALTGTMGTGTVTTAFAAEPIPISPGLTNWNIPASNALCAVTAGTSVSAQGWITYVQQ